MSDKSEILKTLDNTKLMDVIKNYKQHGYDETIRQMAIDILQQRGISVDDLKLSGNFENQQFKEAETCYKSFYQNSLTALACYLLLFISNIALSSVSFESQTGYTLGIVLSLLSILLYFIFLIRSFLDHNRLYKLIGNEYKTSSITIYYLLGAPFYVLFYFISKKQIYNEMKTIR
ncbi:MAG: hypothetical protein N4A74_10385 [Carboxylicivirga sp.]|jgi:lipopolysaccharide export system permease protein|nr:hypothetical protein [Carboxylicivirga sp.]